MLAPPETFAELHARVARDIAATTARLTASRKDMLEMIVATRKTVTHSRELIARADAILMQKGPWAL